MGFGLASRRAGGPSPPSPTGGPSAALQLPRPGAANAQVDAYNLAGGVACSVGQPHRQADEHVGDDACSRQEANEGSREGRRWLVNPASFCCKLHAGQACRFCSTTHPMAAARVRTSHHHGAPAQGALGDGQGHEVGVSARGQGMHGVGACHYSSPTQLASCISSTPLLRLRRTCGATPWRHQTAPS